MKLKKCPFCGGEARIMKYLFINYDTEKPYYVYFVGCDTSNCYGELRNMIIFYTEEEAAEAWNRRAEE